MRSRPLDPSGAVLYSRGVSRSPAPSHQSREVLLESLGLAVVDFRCRAHVEPEGPEEPNLTHSIVFVRRGVFRRVQRRRALVADANHVLYFNAGEPYRYAHPLPGGDDCTILTVETGRALELVAHHSPADAGDAQAPFRRGHALSGPALSRLHYELLGLLRRRDVGRLQLEDALCDLADAAVAAAYRDDPGRRPSVSSAAARKTRRDRVEAVTLELNERLGDPPSLAELAALCGCSPFHLSRAFREVMGVGLREYSRRLRARAAAERLARGASDLTRLGLALGYSDHSHFTNSFRREWGLPPSQFRARLRPNGVG